MVGGAVGGGDIYGSYPDLYSGNPLDTNRGRLIPTMSVDEYFAELALWFGVPPQDLEIVLPNIRRFYTPGGAPPVGFMGPAPSLSVRHGVREGAGRDRGGRRARRR